MENFKRGDLVICMDNNCTKYLQIGVVDTINFSATLWSDVFVVKYPHDEIEEYKKSYMEESFRKIISERM